jgi:hypothetical protein
MVSREQKEFLRQTALYNALGAAFQRCPIYAGTVGEGDKNTFRDDLSNGLKGLESQYHSPVSDEGHCRNISRLADALTNKHGRILKGRRMRVGVAQKAVNSYLKLLWCHGWIAEPPHCPLDRVVLSEVSNPPISWTKMEKIGEYKSAIESVRRYISEEGIGLSIAKWELSMYNSYMAE